MQSSIDGTRPYLDFADIPNSELVLRSKDNHCNRAECVNNDSSMVAAITALYENGVKVVPSNADGSSFAVVLSEKVIPAANPASPTAFLTVQWDLSSVSTKLSGYTFSVEIQHFDNFSYRFRNPKFSSLTPGILQMGGMRPLINGNFDVANSQWLGSTTAVATSPTASALSEPVIIVPVEHAGTDTISFAFDTLQ
jgi:hypothetical protein